MPDITTERPLINAARLDEELRAALGEQFTGLSHDGHTVTAHLAAGATLPQQAQAAAVIAAHDPAAKTARQLEAAARDALPLFALEPAEAEAWAAAQEDAAFRRAMARAFVELRKALHGSFMPGI